MVSIRNFKIFCATRLCIIREAKRLLQEQLASSSPMAGISPTPDQAGIHTLTVGFIYNKGNKYNLKNRNILLLRNYIYLAQKLLGVYQKSNNTL
jgi:hypothetical protein